ncbi:MAG: hypothetical protein AAF959_11120 [Cyanobacteria bacterium P01_D01_bin.56]
MLANTAGIMPNRQLNYGLLAEPQPELYIPPPARRSFDDWLFVVCVKVSRLANQKASPEEIVRSLQRQDLPAEVWEWLGGTWVGRASNFQSVKTEQQNICSPQQRYLRRQGP